MKRLRLNIALFSATCALASGAFAQGAASSAPQMAGEGPDAAFIQNAGQGGMAEVELSKLAATNAQSPAVKDFAGKMVHDHTANNKELATIAAHENIALPKVLDNEHAALRDKLAGEKGADFDHDYVAAMRADHQKMADLLKSSDSTVTTSELHAFSKKTLPVVEAHLKMANELKVD